MKDAAHQLITTRICNSSFIVKTLKLKASSRKKYFKESYTCRT
jgi:hypothetical protein